MQRSNFLARGVFILVVVFALNAPVYALPERDGGREPKKNPVIRIIKKVLKTIGSGDGIVVPWPAPAPQP